MANPSKSKGTGGETELRLELLELLPRLRRTPPTTAWDLEHVGDEGAVVIDVLATRPDRGQWLVTTNLDAFRELVGDLGEAGATEFRFEVKRYARFALHRIWDKKFGETHERDR